jgi:hypothetical protein
MTANRASEGSWLAMSKTKGNLKISQLNCQVTCFGEWS